MGIAVLGPLTVNGSGALGRRDRVVIEALAAHAGRPVSADQLVDALWGDAPPVSAHKILQGCIVRLRKLLGPEAITTTAHSYLLAVPADQIDAQRFGDRVIHARELLSLGEADRAAYLLNEALSCWRGEPFNDLEGWPPAQTEVRRLDELRLEAEELRVDAHLRVGRHSEVTAEAQSLVRAAPLRERRWTLLALAQYQAGHQGEALRTLRRLRTVLVDQLGIDPGPDVVALESAILRQEPSLLSQDDGEPSRSDCPYQGLRPFDVGDADRFFGRQDDVAACLDILRHTSLLALVGPSGSGKSSLLRAGVATALRRRGRPSVVLTPGRHPLEAWTAIEGASPATALLVDQLEEVFSVCEDAEELREFMTALGAESRRRTVVIALRADHLADLVGHGTVSRLVEQGLHLVGGLSEDGLRTAIEAPARQAGLVIEPGLVDLLVREVGDDPGALPLLSHALVETWKRREGNTLTVGGYSASGGIRGAVAQSAEALYAQVEVDRRHLLRDLLLRLVSPGLQGEPVRLRVPRRQVATDPEHDRLIELLVAARLVTSDDGCLALTHEALARAWPRLRGWLDDDVEGQRTLHHLSAAAYAWESLGRPDSELYRGVRLARALEWRGHTSTSLTDTEHDFLEAARRNAEAEAQSAADHAHAQARLIRRLRVVLAGALVLLVLALAAGGMAVVQSNRASRNSADARVAEDQARRAALTAEIRQAGARATTTDDTDESLLLAVAGLRLESASGPSGAFESLSRLTEVLARRPALIRSTALAGSGDAMAVDVSPDGRRLAALDELHHVTLLDLRSGAALEEAQLGRAARESDDVRALQFSPDGAVLAAAASPLQRQPLSLLDGRTLTARPVQPTGLPPGAWQVQDVSFSRDGSRVAAAFKRHVVRGDARESVTTLAAVWPVADPTRPVLHELTNTRGQVAVALSPDGDELYAMPSRRVVDLASGRDRAFHARGPTDRPGGIEVSPDGRLVAFGLGFPRGAVLVDTRTGAEVRSLDTDVWVTDVRFSADGRRLLTTDWGSQRHPQVWDTASGDRLADLTIPGGSEQAVDLHPSGTTVVSAGTDAMRQWDVEGKRRYMRRIPVRGLPWSASESGSCFTVPSSGGRFVAYLPCAFGRPDLEGSYVLLDVARRRARLVPDAMSGWHFGGGSWRAGGSTFIRADGGDVRSFDGSSGSPTGRVHHPSGDHVSDVDHSPDGTVVVAAEQPGRVSELDADTFRARGRAADVGEPVCCVSAGPDEHQAVVLAGGPQLPAFWRTPVDRWALVDLERGSVLRDGDLGFDGVWVAASPDGRHAVATGSHGEVLVIDVRTGRPVRAPVTAHAGGAFWAAFSADGSRLVTSADDGTVVLWDTRTATQMARTAIAAPGLVSAEFLPDGRLLVVPWEGDAAVYVWDPSPERAVEFACRAVGRDLTRAEWAAHFSSVAYRPVCPHP